MKPKTEIKDVKKFLDDLVDEYVQIIIEQTKLLIINEDKEKFEACQEIKIYLDELSNNVAKTISDMSNIEFELSLNKIEENRKYIYKNLVESKV